MKKEDAMKLNRVEVKNCKKYPNVHLVLKEGEKILVDIKDLRNGMFLFDDPEQNYKTERQISFGELDDIIRLVDKTTERIKHNVEYMKKQLEKGKKPGEVAELYKKRHARLKKELIKDFKEKVPAGFILIGVRKEIQLEILKGLTAIMEKFREMGFVIDFIQDVPSDIFTKRDASIN